MIASPIGVAAPARTGNRTVGENSVLGKIEPGSGETNGAPTARCCDKR